MILFYTIAFGSLYLLASTLLRDYLRSKRIRVVHSYKINEGLRL